MKYWNSFIIAFFVNFAVFSNANAASNSGDIQWEVANRFAPFEALGNTDEAIDIFESYRVIEEIDRDFEGWHKRLHDTGTIVQSPYAQKLKKGDSIHWLPNKAKHTEKILNFIRKESDHDTTISIRVHLNIDGTCKWSFSDDFSLCRKKIITRIPLSGQDISVETNGTIISQKLEPDHKVIIGLGDSYGAGEGNPDVPAVWKKRSLPGNLDFSWLKDEKRYGELPDERWVDDTCHRSFYSFQSLTALRIASENQHMFVSFLHYACTGAEIFDGVLAPQYQAWGKGKYVPYSQVNFAIRELCQKNTHKYEKITETEKAGINILGFHRRGGKGNTRGKTKSNIAPNDQFDRKTRSQRTRTGYNYPASGLFNCPNGKLRKPDYVFLSIGGNDIGFADIVQYSILPAKYKLGLLIKKVLFPKVCPRQGNRVDAKKHALITKHCKKLDRKLKYHAGDLIGVGKPYGMEKRYELLFNVLKSRLSIKASDIVMVQFPDPLRLLKPTAAPCEPLNKSDMQTFGHKDKKFDPMSPWNGLKSIAPFKNPFGIKYWQFNLTPNEAFLALRQFDEFRAVLAKTAEKQGITFVCETRDAFLGYGWWEGKFLNLPNYPDATGNGRWKVNDWNPYAYAPKTRAIRTGNDSVLTQPGGTAITGAVHPNLTGTRLIAEYLSNRLLSDMK